MTSIRDQLLAAPQDEAFPYAAVHLVVEALEAINPVSAPGADDGLRVFTRDLEPTDDTETVGVIARSRQPDDNSIEMRGRHGTIATGHEYPLEVVTWVNDADEELGRRVHAHLAALVWQALTTSEILEDDLPGLTYVYPDGTREVAATWGVRSQDFVSDSDGSLFGFISLTKFYISTRIE